MRKTSKLATAACNGGVQRRRQVINGKIHMRSICLNWKKPILFWAMKLKSLVTLRFRIVGY
jgi:hypothetical protein